MKKAKSIEAEDQHRATEIFRVIRKWRKFQEDLEDSMMNPPSDGSKVGVSSSARKRRVDIALTVSDLHQRQRRKVQPILRNAYGDSKKNISSDPRQNDLECAVYALLRKHCLGMPIDIQLLDRLVKFQFYVSNAGISVGSLLVAYPTAINALLEALFTAGTTRIKSDTSIRCATLLALAAVASRQNAIAGSTHRQDLDQDAVKLMHDQVRKVSHISEFDLRWLDKTPVFADFRF